MGFNEAFDISFLPKLREIDGLCYRKGKLFTGKGRIGRWQPVRCVNGVIRQYIIPCKSISIGTDQGKTVRE